MGVRTFLALMCAATGQGYLLQGLPSRSSSLVAVGRHPPVVRTASCQMNMGERFARLVKSNVNQALSSMEDPEKVLTQAVEDMQKDLIKVRQAYAEVSASTKRMGEQCRVAEAESEKWFSRAQLALERGEDDLAREALTRRQQQTEMAASLKEQIEQQARRVAPPPPLPPPGLDPGGPSASSTYGYSLRHLWLWLLL